MQFFKTAVSSVLISSIIVSCGNSNAGGRSQGSQGSKPAPTVANNTTTPTTTETSKVENTQSSGMLLARVPSSQVKTAKPVFVEIPAGTKIVSGAQAAQLFATGKVVDVSAPKTQTNSMALNDYGYDNSYWNWIIGGALVLGGIAMMYYQPIGTYCYDNYNYYPYQPIPGQPVPAQPIPYQN